MEMTSIDHILMLLLLQYPMIFADGFATNIDRSHSKCDQITTFLTTLGSQM
jgi:hypothetical protein